MYSSEKKSLYRFMFIYISTTMLLFIMGAVIFYNFESYQYEENERRSLKQESNIIISLIKNLDKIPTSAELDDKLENINIAVYNGRKEYIFGTFKPKNVMWDRNFNYTDTTLRHISLMPPPHKKLHTAFIVIEKPISYLAMKKLKNNILYIILLVTCVLFILGYFLGRLFIAPMREALEKMNLFVQDTTHELNTPISTILTNIELIGMFGKCEKDSQELKRIEIASKTLSHIYDDLTYLKLNEKYQRKIENIDISTLLNNRVTYFDALVKAKNITISTKVKPNIHKNIDRTDITRIFDNLVSNAIKYNNVGGSIDIKLSDREFVIKDTGRGMSKNTIRSVFERFTRADDSEGGFGIGLDIVSQACKYYGYKIDIKSEIDNGTEVIVRFA